MKNLTKISIIVLISLFSLNGNAQTFGLKAGLSLSNMLDKDDDETYSKDYKMNPGFHLGATVEVPLNEFLSFESGLLFTTKGTKYEEEIMGADLKAKVNLSYLDIPLTLKAFHDLGGGLKMYGAVGPYVGVGIGGKVKGTIEYQGETETNEEEIKWGGDEDEDDLKRLDMGLTFGGGVEINLITLGISYDLGLSNISSYQDYGSTSKNRVLKFSVGYRFGKK
jgi:opacity protein-like surface antigen